jgi:hypothetical protein
MSGIEGLTADHTSRMAEYAERWAQIGLCTDPADRPRAEAAIRDMYQQGGLEPPKKIVWCGSPLSQGLTCSLLLERKLMLKEGDTFEWSARGHFWSSVGYNVNHEVRDSIWYKVRNSFIDDMYQRSAKARIMHRIWNDVGDSVGGSVGVVGFTVGAGPRETDFLHETPGGVVRIIWACNRDSARNIPWFGTRDGAWGGIFDSMWGSVWDSIGDSIQDNRDTIRARTEEYDRRGYLDWHDARVRDRAAYTSGVFGAHEASWLAVYRYFHDVLNLTDQTAKLSGLWELAQSAGWAVPHRYICWVSERHHFLTRDDRGRLHSLTGPACAYPDGWAIHAVHGVRVPAFVVERPAEISVQKIDAEKNVEVRRVMIDRYHHGEEINGAAAFMRDAGGERLDHDEHHGTLWRRNVPGDEPIVMVEVVNATTEPDGSWKRYWLRVDPRCQTAREAVAWTFGMTPEEYAPIHET